jgi:hypothetical protein
VLTIVVVSHERVSCHRRGNIGCMILPRLMLHQLPPNALRGLSRFIQVHRSSIMNFQSSSFTTINPDCVTCFNEASTGPKEISRASQCKKRFTKLRHIKGRKPVATHQRTEATAHVHANADLSKMRDSLKDSSMESGSSL